MQSSDWGEEIMPGVFFAPRAAKPAAHNELLANGRQSDVSVADYRKMNERITECRKLISVLEDSNRQMTRYLNVERKRRQRNAQKESGPAPADEAELMDLPPITPEEDDRVIEESILENALIIKDRRAELDVLLQIVSVHPCAADIPQQAPVMAAEADEDNTDESNSDEESDTTATSDDDGSDDNAPLDDDVVSMQQATGASNQVFSL